MKKLMALLSLSITACTNTQVNRLNVANTDSLNKGCALIDSHHNYKPTIDTTKRKGDVFKLLQNLNFDEGNWNVILSNVGGANLDVHLPSQGFYILADRTIMKRMQQDWIVTYMKDDCCTADLFIDFYRNDTIVFSTGIMLSGQEGFENEVYYWTPSKGSNLIAKYLTYFVFCRDKQGAVLRSH